MSVLGNGGGAGQAPVFSGDCKGIANKGYGGLIVVNRVGSPG